jgi:ATP-dependent Clp protease ATP-binding subunit ClpA
VEKGFDPKMGARPMQRTIDQEIKKPLAKELLFGKLKNGGKLTINTVDNKIVLEIADTVEILNT